MHQRTRGREAYRAGLHRFLGQHLHPRQVSGGCGFAIEPALTHDIDT